MKRFFSIFVSCFLLSAAANGQTLLQREDLREQQWVDSVMNTLSLRQRIAQLFIVPVEMAFGKRNNVDKALQLIKAEQVGGVIVMKAQPSLYPQSINNLQRAAKIPLLVSIDAEWGVSMRMDSALVFPRQMMLGAIADNKWIEKMGEAVAGQCVRIGAQMDYAPVADVNNNPDNPVINIRSFGENKYNVAEKSIAYMRGLQNKGVLACAKHFPGHGDTYQDSHETLPLLPYTCGRMDSLELYPFKALMEANIDAIMIGHLQVPAYDSTNCPSSLSHTIINNLLKDELGYNGFTITDALNMKGITSTGKKDSLALTALSAGNDLLLMPDNVPASIDMIEKSVTSKNISEYTINIKCRKILAAKYRAGLTKYKAVSSRNLLADLNSNENEALRYQLTEKALTLLLNKDSLLPLRRLDTLRIAYLEIGKNSGRHFKEQMACYAAFDSFSIDPTASKDTLAALLRKLKPYNLIIAGWHSADARPQYNFGVDSTTAQFITDLAQRQKVVLDFFGTPYGIKKFKNYQHVAGLIVSYENTAYSQQRSAQLIFGGVAAQGTLPVSIDSNLCFGNGVHYHSATRLHYVLPEEIGISQWRLASIDSMVADAIAQRATPGAQVIAIYKGNVFYNKGFGKYTYDSNAPSVTTKTVYDLASITKVGATLPTIMHFADEGRVRLSGKLGDYLPSLASTNKKDLEIENILTHSSGLKAFQPFQTKFFPNTKEKAQKLDTACFSTTRSAKYPWQVAYKLYASSKVPAYIHRQLDESPLLAPSYRYSDWGFLYLQQVAETVAGKSLDKLADSLFYAPLGMSNTGYLPLKRISKDRIAPTEEDYWRQRVQGTVHDPTAALLGGVAGHAGVFGTANDLAKLFQLYLNGGTYGGERYFSDSIVSLFTRCAACDKGNRRGLGFDKPEPDESKDSPIGREWSLDSYGHSGYVGNLCWVDPGRELIVIFLSNRSFPNDDKKLNRLGTRGKLFSEFVKIIDHLHKPEPGE